MYSKKHFIREVFFSFLPFKSQGENPEKVINGHQPQDCHRNDALFILNS